MRISFFRMICLVSSISFMVSSELMSQDFTETAITLTGAYYSSVDWGDFNNDGYPDLAVLGNPGSMVYKNNGDNTFTALSGIIMPNAYRGTTSWNDCDNDGDLDLLVSGAWETRLFINNGDETFTEKTDHGLPITSQCRASWGDYDNDGYSDILFTGYDNGNSYLTRIYRNNKNNTFSEKSDFQIQSAVNGSNSWGDFDNDGDLDILLCGYNPRLGQITRIYRNDGTAFTDLNAGLPGIEGISVFGDYDNDGDLDVLISGRSWNLGNISSIYRNDAGLFTDISAGLTGITYGAAAAWADYDNDGDLDVLLAGESGTSTYISKVYRNNGGIFTDINAPLTGIYEGAVAWGDYDKDGDLDILLSGGTSSGSISKIYRNNSSIKNTAPSAPSGLAVTTGANTVSFSWNKSTDTQTTQNGLTYNLYVGTTAGAVNYRSPMAAVPAGTLRKAGKGAIQSNSWKIKGLPSGNYYWSVQAIDNSFAGSAFAAESTFSILFSNSIAPEADQELLLSQNGATLTVTESSTPDSRQWMYSTVSGGPYDQLITGATETSYTPNFSEYAAYYIVCVSSKDGISYTTNEVKISVPMFTEQTAISLTGVEGSSAAWGDYDNDGDLDILLTGYANSGYFAEIYRNDAGAFTDIDAGLPGVQSSSVDWGDYDNDGDLDILFHGFYWDAGSYFNTNIYRNDAGIFTDINAGLNDLVDGVVASGDYDNDGDLDILSTGYDGTANCSKIYRNDAGVFTDIDAGLTGVERGSAAWGDYDNDGDLDILLTGSSISVIYRNDNGIFTDIAAVLPGIWYGSASWADYDNDGDLDILLAGSGISRIYRNDAGIFTDISAGLQGVNQSCSAAWGDYDNDGDLDIMIAGNDGSDNISMIYRNDSGIFTSLYAGLEGADRSSVAWGDYDNDGDLDILLTGLATSGRISKVYRNNSLVPNTVPAAPSNLYASASSAAFVSLSWEKASDNQTPQNTLTYNIRMGTAAGGSNIIGPMASSANGYRRIPARGNAGLINEGYPVTGLAYGKYYWSVQAVDQAYAGGTWAPESQFTLLEAPVATEATNIGETSFTANWNSSEGATGYRIDVATDTTFNNFLAGYNNKDIGNVTSTPLTGLTRSTAYFYRIRAYNVGGISIVTSNIIKTNTIGIPEAPVAQEASGIIQVSFTASWAVSTYANGYELDVSTSNTFSTFVTGFNNKDVGDLTSYSVTGLTANTTYYYRVRAYNTYGTSPNSGTITVTTLMNPPATPGGLTATSCNNNVDIQWSAITDANFYRYYIYSGTNPNPTVIFDSTTSATSVSRTYSGLTRGVTYYFRIKAVNTGNVYSAFSNEVSVIVKRGVIPKIKAKWNNVLICYNLGDSLTSWQWYKNDASISNATRQFYVTNKSPGTYNVLARDKSLCYNFSNSINITGAKSAYFYPNPAGNNVTMVLSGEDYGKTTIRFYNSQGVRVLEYQADKTEFELQREITLNSLKTGLYTIEVLVNDEYVDNSRLVIVR